MWPAPSRGDTVRGRPAADAAARMGKSRAAGANAGASEACEESARPEPDPHPQVEVEYVPEKPDLSADDPLLLGASAAVFEKFGLTDHTAASPVELDEISKQAIACTAGRWPKMLLTVEMSEYTGKEEGGWSVIQKGSNERREKNGVDKEVEGERENNDTVEGLIDAEAGRFSEEMVDLPSQVPNGAIGDAVTTRKART